MMSEFVDMKPSGKSTSIAARAATLSSKVYGL
jgi:hypothetical protein